MEMDFHSFTAFERLVSSAFNWSSLESNHGEKASRITKKNIAYEGAISENTPFRSAWVFFKSARDCMKKYKVKIHLQTAMKEPLHHQHQWQRPSSSFDERVMENYSLQKY